MRTLTSGILRLEPQVAAHAEAMFEVLCDPAIYEHENEPPASVEWLRTRFAKLETRLSADGTQQWLNWVVFLPPVAPIGYVQATVYASRRADIAYVLNSRYWGRGLATAAAKLMIAELVASYDVETLSAVLKRTNERSKRLLERNDFALASESLHLEYKAGADEVLMLRRVVAE
jgi:ribosomal-protein-alanine N-acetyltransferase